MYGLLGLLSTSGENFMSTTPLETHLLGKMVTCSILILPAIYIYIYYIYMCVCVCVCTYIYMCVCVIIVFLIQLLNCLFLGLRIYLTILCGKKGHNYKDVIFTDI